MVVARRAVFLLTLSALALPACRGCARPPRARAADARGGDSAREEDDSDPSALRREADAGPRLARCERLDERWLVSPGDAGASASPQFEGASLLADGSSWWAGWHDRRDGRVRVQREGREAQSFGAAEGTLSGPVLVPLAERALAVSFFEPQGRGLREHQVFQLEAGREPVRLLAQTERLGDGMSLAAARTTQGALIAWEEGRGELGSVVLGQLVTVTPTPRALTTLPVAHPLTPPEHDAGDPVLARRADGSLVLLWLAAHDVETDEGNQTASELWARSLSAAGAVVGAPVKLTPRPAARFGVVARAVGEALWVAYRVEGDADQESRGDGGSVALLRLGADLAPPGGAEVLTARGAVPSGDAAVLPSEQGVQVWWAERGSEGLRTMRRAVGADGRALGEPQAEPELHGEVPVEGDSAAPWVLLHGPSGEPGLARFRCPPPGRVSAPGDAGAATRR